MSLDCDFAPIRRSISVLIRYCWVAAILCCVASLHAQGTPDATPHPTPKHVEIPPDLQPILAFELTPLVEPLADPIMPVYHLAFTDESSFVSNAQYEHVPDGSVPVRVIESSGPAFVEEFYPPPNSYPLMETATVHSHARLGTDLGIGHERVMFAPMVIHPAIATNEIGFGLHFDNGLSVPDRAEYFWATDPIGPGGDPSVNVIDTQVRLVVGSPKLTGITQYTLRSLDPTDAANTTGMGDMMVGVQSLMLDGPRLKISSLFQTHLATGSTNRGLGVGHTSLQPGFLWRYCASPSWFWFGEVSYLVPVGGNRKIDGNVLTTGLAVSTIAWESDTFAVLPTLEMRTLSFTSGGQTDLTGNFQNVDGETAVELFPGMRLVIGPALDWGLCEVGVSAGTVFADDDWFDSRIRLNVRFSR